MMNENAYNAMMKGLKDGAENDLRIARSWKKVGHYTTKKDGTPYADPAKAYQNADGIQRIDRDKSYWGTTVWLVNSEGCGINITDLSIHEIEDKIAETIRNAEEDYNCRVNLIAHLHELCERFDNALTAVFATVSDDTASREVMMMGAYFSSYIDDIAREECDKREKAAEQKTA